MPIDDPEKFLQEGDSFLKKLEASRLVSARELESVRSDLASQLRADTTAGAEALQAAGVGGTRVLVRTADNARRVQLTSNRVRQRFSDFRLSYLDRAQVNELTASDTLPENPQKFIRHSRRLARHAREFLGRLQELEPTLDEEIQETLLQIEDNDMDLLKLEIRSFTRAQETLGRGMGSRARRSDVIREARDTDLNRSLWNLSLLEHPAATTRAMLANASERMAERVTETQSQLPKRAHMLVGVPPQTQERMTPGSRTAALAWRVMSQEELGQFYRNKQEGLQKAPSSWRGLGLDYGTNEFYLPVPPEILEGVTDLARDRRRKLLEALAAKALLEGAGG